jgi:hypothetical protein
MHMALAAMAIDTGNYDYCKYILLCTDFDSKRRHKQIYIYPLDARVLY